MSDDYTSRNGYACPLIETCYIYLFVVLLLGSQRRIPHWLGKGQRLYSEIRKVRHMQYAQLVLVILLSVYPYNRTIFLR